MTRCCALVVRLTAVNPAGTQKLNRRRLPGRYRMRDRAVWVAILRKLGDLRPSTSAVAYGTDLSPFDSSATVLWQVHGEIIGGVRPRGVR